MVTKFTGHRRTKNTIDYHFGNDVEVHEFINENENEHRRYANVRATINGRSVEVARVSGWRRFTGDDRDGLARVSWPSMSDLDGDQFTIIVEAWKIASRVAHAFEFGDDLGEVVGTW